MKTMRILTLLVIAIALLYTSGIELYADTGDDSGDTIPFQNLDFDHDISGVLNSNPNNNSCQDALEIFSEEVTSTERSLVLEDLAFPNGNDVDDWYSYTTVVDDCPGSESPHLRLNMAMDMEDRYRLRIEVYDSCGGQPIAEGVTDPWTMSDWYIDVRDINPDETYYIHVNLIDPPENGVIRYTLKLFEKCYG